MSTIPKWAADLLEDEGKQWAENIKLTENEWGDAERSYKMGSAHVGNSSLLWNCGAREICASHCTSIAHTIGLLLYAGSNDNHDPASLIVATVNQYQGHIVRTLVSVGFTASTEWVRNPNSGNNICLLTYNLRPEWFVQPEEEEEDAEWGNEGEEEEEDYDYS